VEKQKTPSSQRTGLSRGTTLIPSIPAYLGRHRGRSSALNAARVFTYTTPDPPYHKGI